MSSSFEETSLKYEGISYLHKWRSKDDTFPWNFTIEGEFEPWGRDTVQPNNNNVEQYERQCDDWETDTGQPSLPLKEWV